MQPKEFWIFRFPITTGKIVYGYNTKAATVIMGDVQMSDWRIIEEEPHDVFGIEKYKVRQVLDE